jgi:hypothetical protein
LVETRFQLKARSATMLQNTTDGKPLLNEGYDAFAQRLPEM